MKAMWCFDNDQIFLHFAINQLCTHVISRSYYVVNGTINKIPWNSKAQNSNSVTGIWSTNHHKSSMCLRAEHGRDKALHGDLQKVRKWQHMFVLPLMNNRRGACHLCSAAAQAFRVVTANRRFIYWQQYVCTTEVQAYVFLMTIINVQYQHILLANTVLLDLILASKAFSPLKLRLLSIFKVGKGLDWSQNWQMGNI